MATACLAAPVVPAAARLLRSSAAACASTTLLPIQAGTHRLLLIVLIILGPLSHPRSRQAIFHGERSLLPLYLMRHGFQPPANDVRAGI